MNKLRAMNQRGAFSSQRPGHEAAYALDDSNGTWWEPAEDDRQPSLTVDLGKAYSTVVDKSSNSITRYTEFDEIPPVRCRYVRLTLTEWPRMTNVPLGVVEFTVFGTAALDARLP